MTAILDLLHMILISFLALMPTADAPAPTPPPPPAVSTIGGTPVPFALACAEDEVIAFTGPDTLACVHIDTFGEG